MALVVNMNMITALSANQGTAEAYKREFCLPEMVIGTSNA
jgi:hypothetical protein